MKQSYLFLPPILLSMLLSCKQQTVRNSSTQEQKLYFIQTSKYGFDTVFTDKPEIPDSTFKSVTTKYFMSPVGELAVEKFTNMPDAPTDGGIEQFYESSVGIFYKRSLTWPFYSRLYSNNDTLNLKISLLMDYLMSQPELANYPKPPTQKIKQWTTPKVQ